MTQKQQSQAIQREGSREEMQRPSSIGPSSPFAFMRRMMDDMDRLFRELGMGGFSSGEPLAGAYRGGTFSPQVEVLEQDGKLLVRADLPGVAPKDVRLSIDDSALVLEGERKSEEERTEQGIYASERSYGSFRRVIALPRGANVESCEARFGNGVLEIELELKSTRRQVPIRGADAVVEQTQEQPQQTEETRH